MSVSKIPATGKWRGRARRPDGSQLAKHFDRRVDAIRWVEETNAALRGGTYVDPRAGKITFREYAEKQWLPAQRHVRESTLSLYGSHLRTHLIPALGNRPLGSIRRSDAKAVVAKLSETLAPATVHTAYAVLRQILGSAVDDELIPANPALKVPLPRVERRSTEPLPPDAVLRLADALPKRYAVTVVLAAGAGLRQGEVLGLLVPRVDFLRRRISVEEQMTGTSSNPHLGPLKTKASRRTVPVDDVVLEAVTEHLRQWPVGPAGLLVTNRLGAPVRRSSFGEAWRAAVETAELPIGTRFHDLRHFYASSLIRAGLHPKAIQARLGHASITETMDVYSHLFPDHEETGRGAMDAVLRRPTPAHSGDSLGTVPIEA